MYYKELVHEVMGGEKSQNLQSATWRLRRADGVVPAQICVQVQRQEKTDFPAEIQSGTWLFSSVQAFSGLDESRTLGGISFPQCTSSEVTVCHPETLSWARPEWYLAKYPGSPWLSQVDTESEPSQGLRFPNKQSSKLPRWETNIPWVGY